MTVKDIRNEDGNVVGIMWEDKNGKFPDELAKALGDKVPGFTSRPVTAQTYKVPQPTQATGIVDEKGKSE